MRRLLLWLVLLCWPALAHALPDTPYDPALMLWYPRLTQAQQRLFDLVYQAAAGGEAVVNVPAGTRYADARNAMDALLLDCPELCALSSAYSLEYYRSDPDVVLSIRLEYVMPAQNQRALVERARTLADGAFGGEFEREWYLHDLLAQQTVYDLEAAYCHTAWGALMDGRAVCDGYAHAMTLLLRLSYMECGTVCGRMTDPSRDAFHAVNLLKVDGAYTWLDATNNDQAELVSYCFFNLTDEWLRRSFIPETPGAADSRINEEQRSVAPRTVTPLPACTDESVNWHVRSCRLAGAEQSVEEQVYSNCYNLAVHGLPFNVRFRTQADYLALRDDPARWLEWYNSVAPADAQVTGGYSCMYNDAQQCLIIRLEDSTLSR